MCCQLTLPPTCVVSGSVQYRILLALGHHPTAKSLLEATRFLYHMLALLAATRAHYTMLITVLNSIQRLPDPNAVQPHTNMVLICGRHKRVAATLHCHSFRWRANLATPGTAAHVLRLPPHAWTLTNHRQQSSHVLHTRSSQRGVCTCP